MLNILFSLWICCIPLRSVTLSWWAVHLLPGHLDPLESWVLASLKQVFFIIAQSYSMSLNPRTWSCLLRWAFLGSQISVKLHLGWIRIPISPLHMQLLNSHSPLASLEVVLRWLCKVSFNAYVAKDWANDLQKINAYRFGGYFFSNPASFSGLSCPDLYLSFSIPPDCHPLFRPQFPAVRRMPQTKKSAWKWTSPCASLFENHSPVMPTAQCLRIVVHTLLPSFIAVNGGKINLLFCLVKNWKS